MPNEKADFEVGFLHFETGAPGTLRIMRCEAHEDKTVTYFFSELHTFMHTKADC
jgi:hypothetical protein